MAIYHIVIILMSEDLIIQLSGIYLNPIMIANFFTEQHIVIIN